MKCANCGAEIAKPEKQQVNGEEVLLPCPKCIRELKDKLAKYPKQQKKKRGSP
jgi:DNA-directed RNA polymerase subunit RPC12/RpoP